MNLHRLILCTLGVAALSCTAFADSLTVSGSTLAETDKSYNDTNSELAALTLGEMAAYTGTNITLSATGNGHSGAHVGTESSLSLTNSVVTSSGLFGWGIHAIGGGHASLRDTSIETSGRGGHGVSVHLRSSFEQTGGGISTTGNNAHGLYLYKGKARLTGVNVKTSGDYSHGVNIMDETGDLGQRSLELIDSNLSVTGSGAHGIEVGGTMPGLNRVSVELNHSTLTGGINSDISGILDLTAGNGSVITGEVSSGTNSCIFITLTGTGTVLHGNLTLDGGICHLTISAGAVVDGGGELNGLTLENGAIYAYHPAHGKLTITDYLNFPGEDDIITINFSGLTETGVYTVLDWSAAKDTNTISVSRFTATGAEGTFSVEHGKLFFTATAVPDCQTKKLNRIIKGYDRVTETDKSYNDTNSELAALTLGEMAAYTGTNITLSATSNYHSGAHVGAEASLSLTNSAITTTGLFGWGIHAIGGGRVSLRDTSIETSGQGSHGVSVHLGSSFEQTGGGITTAGDDAHGLYLYKNGKAKLTGVNVKTSGNKSHGVHLLMDGKANLMLSDLVLLNSTISVTGSGAQGIKVSGTSPDVTRVEVNLDHSTLTGDIYSNSSNIFFLTASNGSVITSEVSSETNSCILITLTGNGTVLHGNLAPAGGRCDITLGAGAVFDGSGELNGLVLKNGAIYTYNPAHGKLTITDGIAIYEDAIITIDFSHLTEAGVYTVLDWSAAKVLDWSAAKVIDTISASRFTATGAEGTFSVEHGKLSFNATAVSGSHQIPLTSVSGNHRLLLNICHGAVLLALVLGVLFVMRRRANLNHQKTKKP
jgi:hypothetical protein